MNVCKILKYQFTEKPFYKFHTKHEACIDFITRFISRFDTEAQKLNIPVFALVDTNSNPDGVDFPIPANDDAFKSISILTKHVCGVIEEALNERKKDKEEATLKKDEEEKKKVDETVA